MNKKVKLARKILTPVSRAMMFTFTLAFGVITVGSTLANANENEVTNFLGGGGNNIVYVDDGTVSTASDFYKSDYNSVKEVREKGFGYSQTVKIGRASCRERVSASV